MIDWNFAVQTGTRLVRPGPQIGQDEARAVVTELRELSRLAQGHVREFTGMDAELNPGPATIVDRPGWIKANVDGFRVVLEPLMDRLAERRPASPFGGPGGVVVQALGARVTGVQVGAILAYMASRVLGQYELFLPPDPSGRTPTGRLTLVAPNIVQIENDLGVHTRDFRLWVCLHEETHRAQFTGVPWLRAYVQEQMTEFLLASDLDPGAMLDRMREAAEAIADAVRGGESSLIDAIQSPEQRVILDRLTAVMTLVEGHGDFVMDAVGPEVVPSVKEIRARFQGRRDGGSRLDKTIRRLLGIDLKMKQYAEGSKFVRRVVAEVGMDGFNKVWASAESLPTIDEIQEPTAWIARVVGTRSLGPAAEADQA
ncbi:coenzyme F420 biosynthesis-associated protein [Actinomadura craniellae]|uniref:Coenzyme F420 biosynthesis-associated protein n=1 Tax=Actinomadura craniellae TaxID=2231787 RepID=A0A365H8M8_9ACTN|nr:zinc-dependent metalloprotease [Actinomadura craniellae]RAY15484.1 coenzyme F420 biosynthesis-associated protein [Actinomadura craniellae]